MKHDQIPDVRNVKGIRRLLELYEQGKVSELTARAIHAVLNFEIGRIALDLHTNNQALAKLAKERNNPTAESKALSEKSNELRDRLQILSGQTGKDLEKLTIHAKRNFTRANNILISIDLEIDKKLAEIKKHRKALSNSFHVPSPDYGRGLG